MLDIVSRNPYFQCSGGVQTCVLTTLFSGNKWDCNIIGTIQDMEILQIVGTTGGTINLYVVNILSSTTSAIVVPKRNIPTVVPKCNVIAVVPKRNILATVPKCNPITVVPKRDIGATVPKCNT